MQVPGGWRLTLAALAFAVVALLFGARSEKDADPSPPEATETESGEDADPVGEGGTRTRDDRPRAAPEETPPSGSLRSSDSVLWDLVSRSPDGQYDWEAVLPALRASAEDTIPILEDWIRRAPEIEAAGGRIFGIGVAYAELAGPRSVPLLIEFTEGRETDHMGPFALARVDDRAAAEFLERLQSAAPAGNERVRPTALVQGSETSRELARKWAETPPGNHAWLRDRCRRALFRFGTEAERERLWAGDAAPGREQLADWIPARWTAPWPARLRSETERGLDAGDPWVRLRALQRIARRPELYDAEMRPRVRSALAFDLTQLGAMDTALLERYVGQMQSVKQDFERLRERRAAEARLREVLGTPVGE